MCYIQYKIVAVIYPFDRDCSIKPCYLYVNLVKKIILFWKKKKKKKKKVAGNATCLRTA